MLEGGHAWRVLWFTVDLVARPITSLLWIREHPVLTWIWKSVQPTFKIEISQMMDFFLFVKSNWDVAIDIRQYQTDGTAQIYRRNKKNIKSEQND